MKTPEGSVGPLLPIWRSVSSGTLPLDDGCQRARQLGAARSVTPGQLEALSELAFRLSTSAWREAWALVQIVHAAADAAQEPLDEPYGGALTKVAADLVYVAHIGLLELGDIRLYRTALAACEKALTVARRLSFVLDQGVLLERRGSMILDVFTANRTPANYDGEFKQWVDRAVNTGDPGLLELLSDSVGEKGSTEANWPTPLAAMDLAEQDLRAALELVDPTRVGYVLKVLSQTLEWRGIFGGPVDRAALAEVCRGALDTLAQDDAQDRLAVEGTLRRAESPEDESSEEPTEDATRLISQLENDWDAYTDKVGAIVAWELTYKAAASLVDSQPSRALALLRRRTGLRDLWADDARRAEHLRTEVYLLARGYAPEWVSHAWASPDLFAELSLEVLAAVQCRPGHPRHVLTDREVSGALALVALASTKFGREPIGIDALLELQQREEVTWNEHAEAFQAVFAALHQGEAINLERRGHTGDALAMYLKAASLFLAGHAGDQTVGTLNYMSDLIEAGVAADLSELSAWCTAYALAVELLSPASGPSAIQRLVSWTLASQVASGTSLKEVNYLFQAAKGRRFGSLLSAGATGWKPDPAVTWLLEQESLSEQRLTPDTPLLRPASWEEGLDAEDLVTAYASEFETSSSETPEGEVINHQRAVERRIATALSQNVMSDVTVVSVEEIQQALDSRTALLLHYGGRLVDGRAATYTLLLTDTQGFVGVGATDSPYAVVNASAGGRTVQLPLSGLYVGSIRRAVQVEPAPLDIGREGSELLGSASDYLRLVNEHHNELRRAGKDRLLVIPHGAEHFLPWHLIGPAGSPVADDWTVTYLATLSQLTSPASRTPAHGTSRSGAGIFGLSYRDQPRLPQLDSSLQEACSIASTLEVEPILDEKATEPSFIRALETCRYVHLRAHGQHNTDAPLFQSVFLTPGDGKDGRLRAHEVLPLDLRGLELVTLSACETALGRVDISDNPRGLPAALLLAGARTVVGTMWEVLAEASEAFFVEFYRNLVELPDDLVECFGRAQRATRQQFPEYRDWGAFFMTGGAKREELHQ